MRSAATPSGFKIAEHFACRRLNHAKLLRGSTAAADRRSKCLLVRFVGKYWRYAALEPVVRIPAMTPGGSLIWATTTAVKAEKSPGPTNSRVNERNNIAQSFVRAEAIL